MGVVLPFPSTPPAVLSWRAGADGVAVEIVVNDPYADGRRAGVVAMLRQIADVFEGAPGEVLFTRGEGA